jgi:hypothetical protein
MTLRLLVGSRGNRGNQRWIEVTSKINIYNFKVTLVTLVTSILPRACEKTKKYRIKFSSQKSPILSKNEVTEVTRPLTILNFWLPLPPISYLWLPLLSVLEASYE